MTSEQKFISECIKIFLENGSKKALRDAYKKTDKKKLANIIIKQNIAGLFYHLYSKKIFDDIRIAHKTFGLWKAIAGKNSILNEINDREAVSVAKLFDKHAIDYIYLKGLSTRLRSYEIDYIKHSVDIDLFIKRQDYPKAKSVLLQNSYFIPKDHYRDNIGIAIPFEEFEKNEHEITFVRKEDSQNLVLDLQWDFIDADRSSVFHDFYDINSLYDFSLTDSIKVKGYGLKMLDLEAELINMAYHFAFHHSFRGVGWFVDICALIKNNLTDIDFDLIARRSNKNTRKVLGIVFMLAFEYISGEKPDRKWKKTFCVDRMLPFEYRYYKNMTFQPVTGISNSISLFVTKILLPYSLKNRFSALKYMLFNPDSIGHRIKKEERGRKIFLPLQLLELLIYDMRRKKTSKVN